MSAEVQRAVVDSIREVDTPAGDPIAAALVDDVEVVDGVATVVADLERTDVEMADRLVDQLRGAALATPGVDFARVRALDAGDGSIPGVGATLLLGGAKGGVGRSTITVSLARTLADRGHAVGVFDADVHCPDATHLLGPTGPIVTSPSGRLQPATVDEIEVVGVDLIADQESAAWRGAMVHDSIVDLLETAAWSDRDVVLVDLPPGIGDPHYALLQRTSFDAALLVTTPTAAAGAALERTAALLETSDVPLLAVVANMTAPACGGPAPFGDEELAVDLPSKPRETVSPLPHDLAMHTAPAASALEGETAEALEGLADAVEEFLSARTVDDEAVDLRGLPPRSATTQALLEADSAGPDGVRLLTSTDPETLCNSMEQVLSSDDRSIEVRQTEAVDSGGWALAIAMAE